MKVLLNGKQVAMAAVEGSVADLVRTFYSTGDEPGQMITEIRVNGEPMPLDSTERIVSQETTVEMVSLPTEVVSEHVLGEIRNAVAALVEEVNQGAACFRSGSESEAHSRFSRCAGSLLDIYEMAQDLEMLRVLTKPGGADEMPAFPTDALDLVIAEIVATQEEGDWVLLADLMEYELLPVLNNWKQSAAATAGEVPLPPA